LVVSVCWEKGALPSFSPQQKRYYVWQKTHKAHFSHNRRDIMFGKKRIKCIFRTTKEILCLAKNA
jgi:hypothetical protein